MLVQLQPSCEAFPYSLYPFKRSGRGCPLLRASSEHILIARLGEHRKGALSRSTLSLTRKRSGDYS